MQTGSDPLTMVAESLFDLIPLKPEDKISDSWRSPLTEQNLRMQRSAQPQAQGQGSHQRGANKGFKFGNQLR